MKITKGKIIAAVAILVVLVAAFWWGGNSPGLQGFDVNSGTEVATDADVNNDDAS